MVPSITNYPFCLRAEIDSVSYFTRRKLPGYIPLEVARFTISAEQLREKPPISGPRQRLRGLGNVETTKLQLGWFYSTFRRGHAVFTVLGIYDALNYPVCNKTRGGTRMTPRWTNKREITVKPGSPLRGYLSFSIVRHGYSGALRETRRKRTVKTVGCLAGWMFPGSLPDRLKRGDRCLIRCFACKGKTGRPGWRMRLIIIFTRFVALRL